MGWSSYRQFRQSYRCPQPAKARRAPSEGHRALPVLPDPGNRAYGTGA